MLKYRLFFCCFEIQRLVLVFSLILKILEAVLLHLRCPCPLLLEILSQQMKDMNKPEMCRKWRLRAAHGSSAGQDPCFWAVFTLPPGAAYRDVFFQSESQMLKARDVQWIDIAVCWPAVVSCLLGGTQKGSSRRMTLFGISRIRSISIPTSLQLHHLLPT